MRTRVVKVTECFGIEQLSPLDELGDFKPLDVLTLGGKEIGTVASEVSGEGLLSVLAADSITYHGDKHLLEQSRGARCLE